jgi:tetratricopeptide (TPR) repeat protein
MVRPPFYFHRAVSLVPLFLFAEWAAARPLPEGGLCSAATPTALRETLERANMLFDEGQYDQAAQLYEHALPCQQALMPSDALDIATSLGNLAEILRLQKQFPHARSLFERSLEIREAKLGVEAPAVAMALNGLAALHADEKRYYEAEPLVRRALSIWKKHEQQYPTEYMTALNTLGVLHLYLDDPDGAERRLQEAMALRPAGIRDYAAAVILHNFGNVKQRQGLLPEAEELFRAALEMEREVIGEEHPMTKRTVKCLALLLKQTRRKAEARRMLESSGIAN